jgi:hypothetical protein
MRAGDLFLKEGNVDLRLYFHKVRTIEATMPGDHVVVVSLETPDGGREGRFAEVVREVAAKLVVQGKVRLANEDETEQFKAAARAAKEAADEQLLRDRLHLSVLQKADVELIRSALKNEQ